MKKSDKFDLIPSTTCRGCYFDLENKCKLPEFLYLELVKSNRICSDKKIGGIYKIKTMENV